MRTLLPLLSTLVLSLSLASPAGAQSESRFGMGAHILGSTADDNVGPGLFVRVSRPVNQDVSLAIGSGLTGYIFRGQDDASFALDPQLAAVVSFDSQPDETTYVLGGAGAYVPFGDTSTDSGPTFHLGVGRAWLLTESSVFFEFNPGFLVGEERTTLVLPLRLGIIL